MKLVKISLLICVWSLSITLTACNDGPPIAFRDSPEASVRQGVSRDGWPMRVSDLHIHDQRPLPQGELFLISGKLGPEHDSQPTIGLVDAKRSWRGWYAHGWRDLSSVLSADSQPLQAALLLYESARVIVGRAPTAEVEITCGTAMPQYSTVLDGLFVIVVANSREPCTVRAINADGAEVTRIVVTHPR